MNNIQNQYNDFKLSAAHVFDVDFDRVTRKRENVEARYAVWYAMKQLHHWEAQISELTIYDRSTVIYGVNSAQRWKTHDKQFAKRLQDVIDLKMTTDENESRYKYHARMAEHYHEILQAEPDTDNLK